jgi:hypothetical protein
MGFKFYKIDKQVNKKYFKEHQGSNLLYVLEEVNKPAYRKIRKMSKLASARETGKKIGYGLAKILYNPSNAA